MTLAEWLAEMARTLSPDERRMIDEARAALQAMPEPTRRALMQEMLVRVPLDKENP